MTFEAQPDQEWEFDHWEGDLSDSENPDSLTVSDPVSVTAVFEEMPLVTFESNEGGRIQVGNTQYASGATTHFPSDTTITLETFTRTGWTFDRWTGDISGTEKPRELTVSEDLTVGVEFRTKTLEEALTWGRSGVVIGPVVQSMTYTLESDFLGDVFVSEFTLENNQDETVKEKTVNKTLSSGGEVEVQVGFQDEPLWDDLKKWPFSFTIENEGTFWFNE